MKKLITKKETHSNEVETKAAKIVEIVATAATPTIPTIEEDGQSLMQSIIEQENEIAEVEKLRQQPNQPEEYYIRLHDRTQELACIKLRAECRLGAMFKKLKGAQGKRKAGGELSKQEVAAKFRVSSTQRKQYEKLTPEAVEAEISRAILANDIPNRGGALKVASEDIKAKNTKEFPCRNVFASSRPVIEGDLKEFLSGLKATSLFACGGVGTALLHKLGVKLVLSNELLPKRCAIHQAIHGATCDMVPGDIYDENVRNEIVEKHFALQSRVICSTNPCQDFTPLNSKRDFATDRAALFMPMLDVLRRVNEVNDYFILENVKEYLTASPECLQDILNGKTIVEYIISELEDMGYTCNWAILDASFYGCSQSRKRLILTASKHGLWEMPTPDKFRKMLWQTIGDLPSLENGEDSGILWHKTAKLPQCQVDFLAKTPTGKKAVNPCKADGTPFKGQKERKARNSWEIAGTITTSNGEVLGDKVWHPGRKKPDGTYSDCRCFTILELLRITGLNPEDFTIPTDTPERLIRELLGEALMPTLLNRIFETIPMPQAC